jgi:hypothetical protein
MSMWILSIVTITLVACGGLADEAPSRGSTGSFDRPAEWARPLGDTAELPEYVRELDVESLQQQVAASR